MSEELIHIKKGTVPSVIHSSCHMFCNIDEDNSLVSFRVTNAAAVVLEIVNLLDNQNTVNFNGDIIIDDNCELKIVIVDFASSSVNFNINSTINNNSRITVDLATVSSSNQKKIFDIKVKQLGLNSYSYVKMSGVSDGKTTLSLLGTTDIVKGAKKSFTCQEGTIVNLSDEGKTQVSPILKIAENDIKASHSAKLGKVSDDIMFYLMSRGLNRREASSLLTVSYLKPVIEQISVKEYQTHLLNYIEKRDF